MAELRLELLLSMELLLELDSLSGTDEELEDVFVTDSEMDDQLENEELEDVFVTD